MKNEFDYLNDVKMDLSLYGEETVSEKEIKHMKQNINKKKRIGMKKLYVLAACVAVTAITGTAFASGFVGDIIKSVSTGYNTFVQTDASAPQEMPDALKGRLFDENGRALSSISKNDIDNLYDENGERVDSERLSQMYYDALGDKVKIALADDEDALEDSKWSYADIDEARNNAVFDIKIPDHLPEGYELSRIYTFKDGNGSASGDYVNMEYTDESGSVIYIFERILNEETRFSAGTDGTLDEISINGQKAVIMDDTSIDWETEDNVSVGISTGGSISRDELIKMAESVK